MNKSYHERAFADYERSDSVLLQETAPTASPPPGIDLFRIGIARQPGPCRWLANAAKYPLGMAIANRSPVRCAKLAYEPF